MENLTLEELDLLLKAMETHFWSMEKARVATKLTFERNRPDEIDLMITKLQQAISDKEFEDKKLNF